MSLTRFTQNVSYHSELPDQPTQPAAELKKIWDQGVNDIKNYINNTLLGEIESEYFPVTGGEIKGTAITRNIIPKTKETYTLGNNTNTFKEVFANRLIQKQPILSGASVYENHSFGFVWHDNALRVAIDADLNNIFLVHSMNNKISFGWTSSGLALYVDNTFIGYVSMHS